MNEEKNCQNCRFSRYEICWICIKPIIDEEGESITTTPVSKCGEWKVKK